MTAFDHLAPYPNQPADVTVDNLARFETVEAFAYALISHKLSQPAHVAGLGSPEMNRYVESLRAVCAQVGVIHLLRAFHAAAPEQAEQAARELWLLWDDGETGEWLTDRLEGYGIDPEQIIQMVGLPEARPLVEKPSAA